jgi:hypothetical protein
MSTKQLKNRIAGSNIFTEMISDHLGVTIDVALRVHNYISENYNLDWSEAEEDEINFYADLAFNDLNVTHSF